MSTPPTHETLTATALYIEDVLARNADVLEKDTQEFVLHYLNHDEYEMAFEGLFLDLMQLGRFQSSFDIAHAVHLAKALNLHQESVFRDDFWPLFEAFTQTLARLAEQPAGQASKPFG